MSRLPIIFFFFLLLAFFPPTARSDPVLHITPTVLAKSGDPVHIRWSGVNSPSKQDWLGIYSPPDSPDNLFIGYIFLNTSSTYLSSGSGSITIPLTNLRSNYSFRIFHWPESEVNKHHDHDNNQLPVSKHLLAKSSSILGFESGRGPEQIHLSYTDRVDEMRVMFITEDKDERYVRYGEREEVDGLSERATTRVERYEREDMCDFPANDSVGWRDPGWIHNGVMKNLKGGVKYYYQVGSDSKGWSKTYSFMPRDENSNETIAFLFGDMGAATPYKTYYRTQDESIATVNWILRDIEALGDKPSFVSHIGDISYARGFSWVWDHFFTQIKPIAARVPYHVCIGNHEYDWPSQPWKPDWASTIYGKDGGGECGVPYSLKFAMPGNSSEPTGTRAPATRNLYYSFDMGVVHFLYFSTETNFLPGSGQYDFIKKDLESVNRNKTPFVVVQGHRPMYTTSYEYRDAPIRVKMLKHLEPLFVKNNVTLAFWGHVHRYERFCPINNFTCGDAYPVHVVIGMAGQDWQPIWQPRPNHLDVPIFPQPASSLYRGGEFGYTRLVATREKLTLSYVGNHDGEVHDMMEILPSGKVLSGSSSSVAAPEPRAEVAESTFSLFFMGVSVLLLGVFVGYVLGYITRTRREARSWTPVKSEET